MYHEAVFASLLDEKKLDWNQIFLHFISFFQKKCCRLTRKFLSSRLYSNSNPRGVSNMALTKTIQEVKQLLQDLQFDLEKASSGNKAAAQRVRTGTVKLEKVAKLYRKESIADEKKRPAKKAAKKPAKKAAKKAAPKKAAAKKPAAKRTAAKKPAAKKPAAKRTTAKKPAKRATAGARAFAVRRSTAKLPARRRARA